MQSFFFSYFYLDSNCDYVLGNIVIDVPIPGSYTDLQAFIDVAEHAIWQKTGENVKIINWKGSVL